MSPIRTAAPAPDRVARAVRRLSLAAGYRLREERLRRRWSLREVAQRSGLSVGVVQGVEVGRPAFIETYARIADALHLSLELVVSDPRRRDALPRHDADLVHAAMGELEVSHLAAAGFETGVDEPYQHYQFAGRADVVAWHRPSRALLHIENRTSFPDIQSAAGSWNAKRSYLAPHLAERLGVGRWTSVTHVMAVLWSSEVLHSLRLRESTFRALCPDDDGAFLGWWAGSPPTTGTTSTLVVLDAAATRPRQRRFCSLNDGLRARPRYRNYAEAAQQLRAG
jgi:transcriptional regulator with XRE-family HTH domain